MKFKDFPNFNPNVTPKRMFELGVFGGTYFRPIHSSVTGKNYKNVHHRWRYLMDMDQNKVSSCTCDKNVNYFKEISGSSLDMWESKGWITEYDPYGWVEWYINFSEGRRCPDDERQIKRWEGVAGPKGRFRKMQKRYPNSKKLKQLLLQWAVLV
jgi:hypothetical protein